jgi:hypothetical protein
MTNEEKILEIALRVMTDRLDMLVSACLGDDGKPKQPSMKDVMQARGYLPPRCKNSFNPEKST